MEKTKEDILREYKEHQEKVAKLPKIYRGNMQEIVKFLDSHKTIRSKKEANGVLEYFAQLEAEWKEYYLLHPSDVYSRIHNCISAAYFKLKQIPDAVSTLETCLSVIAKHQNYRYLFKIKADIYFNLAVLYFNIDDLENTRVNMRKGVFQLFAKSNNMHYDNFAFYAFRPLNKYVIEGINNNQISLSNPCTFNDPVDPALITHFETHIKSETKRKEKEYLKLQQEVYKEFRITCLSRAIPLPTGKIDCPAEKDPEFKEISRATMWGYYAKSHTGICIKYVFPADFTDIERYNRGEVLMLRNVKYKKMYNPKKDSFNYIDAFFAKGDAWKHEGECRLAYFREDGMESDFPWIDLPKGCIKEIYIGYRASKRNINKLKIALINQPQVKLFRMQPSKNNIFKFNPIQININEL